MRARKGIDLISMIYEARRDGGWTLKIPLKKLNAKNLNRLSNLDFSFGVNASEAVELAVA